MDWNAITYFQSLTTRNVLAQQKNFHFCRVSGLEGFEEAIHRMQKCANLICVSEVDDGLINIHNTPHTSHVKLVCMSMRHKIDDMAARRACFATMHEIFRQFMSDLILEEQRISLNHIYLNENINFHEIPEYFCTGCACAYFQIKTTNYANLAYNANEWIPVNNEGVSDGGTTDSTE